MFSRIIAKANKAMKVVIHVDINCFYCQVHSLMDPSLKGKPVVVRQWHNICAVSYEAREFGIQRFMSLTQAKSLCPGLIIVQTPVKYGKICNGIYRSKCLTLFTNNRTTKNRITINPRQAIVFSVIFWLLIEPNSTDKTVTHILFAGDLTHIEN